MNQFFVDHAAVFFILLIVFLICGITFVSYMVQKQQELRRRIKALSLMKEEVRIPEPRDVRTPEEYAASLALMNDKLEALTTRIQGGMQDQINECLCKTKMVRYNAFDGLGGELSFIWVLLDAKNNGFILHNIYNREGNSNLYTRIIENGAALTHLAPEEEAVLAELIRRQPWETPANLSVRSTAGRDAAAQDSYVNPYSGREEAEPAAAAEELPADTEAETADEEQRWSGQ
ncbi:MAG: DUF4446 family protein [Firmicutes bacterium]|nr:DUF4446 family protein [Bacillota bacterium]